MKCTCMCMNVFRERRQMSLAVGNLLLSAWNQGVSMLNLGTRICVCVIFRKKLKRGSSRSW